MPIRDGHASRLALSVYTSLLLILAEGRGSELVHERAGIVTENVSSELPYSRTSEASPGPLPRPAGRSQSMSISGLMHNAQTQKSSRLEHLRRVAAVSE
ncbi:hypothetical protein F4W70_10455 [Pseudomonas cannabina]|nr:hypothetical protein F4W70_10455 [Pseudomonas cannabina]